MRQNNFRFQIEKLLASADVQIGGDNPWDFEVHNQNLYARLLSGGSLALGESYMDGWWDCVSLDEFFYRILKAKLGSKIKTWPDFFHILRARVLNLQKGLRAYTIGTHHYDIDKNLYQHMLDKRLIYSCGYWKHASTLDEAQEAKLDLVCRKLNLHPGMRILDIGCGWGGTAKFAAENYQVEVVGITVSEKQARFAQECCRGFPIDIRLQDYRSITEVEKPFDRILSLGMFEHVGSKNYSTFMRTVRDYLTDDGLFLLHTIGGSRSVIKNDPWIERYIFPNSMLPSAKQICSAIENIFILEDWENLGPNYYKTLMQWFRNFHQNWDRMKDNYDERFYRMWKYYLLSCAGSFRARENHVWQIILSPKGIPEGYQGIR